MSALTAKTRERRADNQPEPTDDLVTTTHERTAGQRTLALHRTTGRVVLREEVHGR